MAEVSEETKRKRREALIKARAAKEEKKRKSYLDEVEGQIEKAVEKGNDRLLNLDYEVKELERKRDEILDRVNELLTEEETIAQRVLWLREHLKGIVSGIEKREREVAVREKLIAS
jgi:hypothetical protein